MLGFLWDCPSSVSPLQSSQLTTWVWLLHGEMFWLVFLVTSLTVCSVQMIWNSVAKAFEMGCPGLMRGEQSSGWIIFCPPDGPFFPLPLRFFHSWLTVSVCCKYPDLSVGLEKKKWFFCQIRSNMSLVVVSQFVRHWNCSQKPTVGSIANLTQAVNWKGSTSFILETRNVSSTPAYYFVT